MLESSPNFCLKCSSLVIYIILIHTPFMHPTGSQICPQGIEMVRAVYNR